MLVIASVDDYGAPTRAIGCALIIFRSVSFFLAVLFHRAHINACFWKQSKQLGKLRLHLLDVVTIGIEQLLAGSGDELGIGLQRSAKALEVGEAKLLRNGELLALNARDFFQAKLVDRFSVDRASCL